MSSEAQAPLAEPADVDLGPGCVVGGRYELVRQLGHGASGVVWLANHALLASEVAVKFLDSVQDGVLDADLLVERFRFEAQVSARLGRRTDRIVAVHDGGIFQGMPFIVMDFIEGESAEAMLERAPLPIPQVALLVRHIADALEAAHQEGIAHRDVKPGNILAVRSASSLTFKLADFGIAKMFGSAPKGVLPPRSTAEQVLVGSPAYMSPETISTGQPTNGAADTWALAVTVYECLTQRLPFAGEAWPNIAVAIVSGRYEPPSAILGARGAPFDSFFRRAFAAEVADRFASPSELATAFEAIAAAAGDEHPQGPMPSGATLDSLARDDLTLPKTKWGWPAAAAGGAALLLVGGAMWLLQASDPASARANVNAAGPSTASPPTAADAPSTADAATTAAAVAGDPLVLGATAGVSSGSGAPSSATSSARPPNVEAASLQPAALPTVGPASAEGPRVAKPPRRVDPSDTQ